MKIIALVIAILILKTAKALAGLSDLIAKPGMWIIDYYSGRRR